MADLKVLRRVKSELAKYPSLFAPSTTELFSPVVLALLAGYALGLDPDESFGLFFIFKWPKAARRQLTAARTDRSRMKIQLSQMNALIAKGRETKHVA